MAKPIVGDTERNEIEFVPATIVVRSAGLPKSVLSDPRGWATANGIRWRCFGGHVYFAVLDVDSWRPETKVVRTVKPEASKPTVTDSDELAALRARQSSLENEHLLLVDRLARGGVAVNPADYATLQVLGKPHGLSAQDMNVWLIEMGFQTVKLKPKKSGKAPKRLYSLTDLGREYGWMNPGHRSSSGYQGFHIEWKPSVVPIIQKHIANKTQD
jgi:hypothetical protein